MLHLQTAQAPHAPQWLALINNDRACLEHWMPYLQTIKTEQEAIQYIQENTALSFYTGEDLYELWVDENLAGILSLHGGDLLERSVEIGYWLGKNYRGQGWVTTACRLVFSKVFATTAVETIRIRCAIKNYASQAVPKRLGLAVEGEKEGIISYVLSKAQWMTTGFDEDDLLQFIEDDFLSSLQAITTQQTIL